MIVSFFAKYFTIWLGTLRKFKQDRGWGNVH